MTVLGSTARLTPVLMTVLVTAFALTPLPLAANASAEDLASGRGRDLRG